jgi:recombination protein RecT
MSPTTEALADRRRTVRDFIGKYREQLEHALPKHVSADRLLRTFFTELSKTPTLLDCSDVSLLGALIQAAQLGLEFGALGHAYLVPFRRGQRLEVQLVPGYKGLLKLARNTGQVSTVAARIVHVGDDFQMSYEPPMLHHVPRSKPTTQRVNDRTELVWPATHYYASARLMSGDQQFEVMSREEVEAHRDRYAKGARNPDSAWQTNFPEMALKTVLRRLCRLLPASVELERALVLDHQARHEEPQRLGTVAGMLLPELPVEDEDPEPAPADADAERVAAELAEELSVLRTRVNTAEVGLTEAEVTALRMQHLRTPDLPSVREPAVLQDYLTALPRVPRLPANPKVVAALLASFERAGVSSARVVAARGGRVPAKWTAVDIAELTALIDAGPEAIRDAFAA